MNKKSSNIAGSLLYLFGLSVPYFLFSPPLFCMTIPCPNPVLSRFYHDFITINIQPFNVSLGLGMEASFTGMLFSNRLDSTPRSTGFYKFQYTSSHTIGSAKSDMDLMPMYQIPMHRHFDFTAVKVKHCSSLLKKPLI